MTTREDSSPWIAAAVILGVAVAVSLLSGCATQPIYEAAVQVDADGDVVCAFKVRN